MKVLVAAVVLLAFSIIWFALVANGTIKGQIGFGLKLGPAQILPVLLILLVLSALAFFGSRKKSA